MHRTVILSLVLFGHEAGSVMLSGEHGVGVSQRRGQSEGFGTTVRARKKRHFET